MIAIIIFIPRKRLVYLLSGLLVLSGTATIATHGYLAPLLSSGNDDMTKWLPLVGVILMYTGFGLGYGPIVFILQVIMMSVVIVMKMKIMMIVMIMVLVMKMMMTIVYILQGELLPANLRGLGSGILGMTDNILMTVVIKTIPSLIRLG